MNINDYEDLSKEISYALRHDPNKYDLVLDENGWANINDLIKSLKKNNKWKDINVDTIKEMINLFPKKRHEISDNKIRAFYGHSIPTQVKYEKSKPPKFLYHGTARRFLNDIFKDGLKSMNRQYVHLSSDIETAINVGQRHDAIPVIIVVDAQKAFDNGIDFFIGNDKIWLAKAIPTEYFALVYNKTDENVTIKK